MLLRYRRRCCLERWPHKRQTGKLKIRMERTQSSSIIPTPRLAAALKPGCTFVTRGNLTIVSLVAITPPGCSHPPNKRRYAWNDESESDIASVAKQSLSKIKITGISQESKRVRECWRYEQHQHSLNTCSGKVPDWLTLSQLTHELCKFSVPMGPSFA